MTTTPPPGSMSARSGLVEDVVELVNTGPVPLGAYTLAELTAVDAVVDFLEAQPSEEALAEAVRSLAARQMLVPAADGVTLQVRGDLGIALTFQQRARCVLDARVSGTEPGEPWRVLLLPQPERITLEFRIDALGVHELCLYPTKDALRRLVEWLPRGELQKPDTAPPAYAALESSTRSGLVSVTRYSAQGSTETAESTDDVVLVAKGDRLHLYEREAPESDRLRPKRVPADDVHDVIRAMLPPPGPLRPG